MSQLEAELEALVTKRKTRSLETIQPPSEELPPSKELNFFEQCHEAIEQLDIHNSLFLVGQWDQRPSSPPYSGTEDTDYDSDNLPDDPELSAKERIIKPKAYFQKLEFLERHIFNNSGLFIHETGISRGTAQDEALLHLPASKYLYFQEQTDFLLDIKSSGSKIPLELLTCHNRAHLADNNLTLLQENRYCGRHISILVQDLQ
ncbi:hypothetical protein NHQ30_011039 [Ciborinia camelliae]|nr:hypothetical protein NHQ30_011039 [Ciborinia camelliae]